MDRLERFERWVAAVEKFAIRTVMLVCVFLAGVVFTVLVFVGSYIATGGK